VSISIIISICYVTLLLTHAALVNAISAGEIMLAMHQVAAMLWEKVVPFFGEFYLSESKATRATIYE
jgi:hypothetical protein